MIKPNSILLILATAALLCAVAYAGMNNFQTEQLYATMAHHPHAKNSGKEKSSAEQENIRVHLIPHTHDDIGWLKTVDWYYYGAQNSIQYAGVQYIIDAVIESLLEDARRRFIYVEMGFFWRWWRQQDEAMRASVRQLVKVGQLQFINGGWCMNDEAGVYYEDVIEQMTLGHQFLFDTFGTVVSVGWHIDPFGHQNSQASLFSQMGFNGMFFGRADYQDKDQRLVDQGMEFWWSPRQDSGEDNSLLGILNYNGYSPPPGFCFDIYCNDNPVMYNPKLENYNLPQMAVEFAEYFRDMSQHYRQPILQFCMGMDFFYLNADIWYKNLDLLIDYINQHPELFNMEFIYSTPADYLKDINDYGARYPNNRYDFMPYADNADSYWTGYFTSRVADKGQVRYTGRWFQSVRTYLAALRLNDASTLSEQLENEIDTSLFVQEEALAILQHHDAVAGTAKQYVQNDYYFRMNNGTVTLQNTLNKVLKEQILEATNEDVQDIVTCYWNYTANNCPLVYTELSAKRPVLLTLLNPSQINTENTTYIRVKVPNILVDVFDEYNNPVLADQFCLNSTDANDCTLFFQPNKLTSYQLNFFKIVPTRSSTTTHRIRREKQKGKLFSGLVQVGIKKWLYAHSDAPAKITLSNCEEYGQSDCENSDVQLLYNYYKSYQGPGQNSGAYIFRPAGDTFNHSIPYSPVQFQNVFVGDLLTILRLRSLHVETYVYIFKDTKDIEIETFLQQIPVQDGQGKEIVMIVKSNINNNKTWYTDSYGLEMQKRVFNYRPTWDLIVEQPAAGNYYPCNAIIYIEDQNQRLALINDRAQGVTSLDNGEIEVMLHRRLLKDDDRGVGEPLNESNSWNDNGLEQRFRHFLIFESPKEEIHRAVQQKFDQSVVLQFSKTTSAKFQQPVNHKQPLFSGLPASLKVYLRYLKDKGIYLLRLSNLSEQQSVKFRFEQVGFDPSEWKAVRTTLTGTQTWDTWQANQLKWNHDAPADSEEQVVTEIVSEENDSSDNALTVTVKPLQNLAYLVSPLL